nr:MAG TPA: hypothetical protein [Caudoviricetes sp.]
MRKVCGTPVGKLVTTKPALNMECCATERLLWNRLPNRKWRNTVMIW